MANNTVPIRVEGAEESRRNKLQGLHNRMLNDLQPMLAAVALASDAMRVLRELDESIRTGRENSDIVRNYMREHVHASANPLYGNDERGPDWVICDLARLASETAKRLTNDLEVALRG